MFSIVTGSNIFANKLVTKLEEYCISTSLYIRKAPADHPSRHDLYIISTNNILNLYSIYEMMYVYENCPKLNRKYIKFTEFYNLPNRGKFWEKVN